MLTNDPERNVPPEEEFDDENDDSQSGDQEVLDELVEEPTPKHIIDSDLIIQESQLPESMPGRADNSDEDLTTLFRDASKAHFKDGFTGSGDEDGKSISQNDGDDLPDHPV